MPGNGSRTETWIRSPWGYRGDGRQWFRNFAAVLFACCLIAIATKARAAEDHLLGFQFGDTLAEARRHAVLRGWRLSPLSEHLPKQWLVEGTEASLYICDDKIVSITQRRVGHIDEFATIVQQFSFRIGQPEIQVVTFFAGAVRVANIDARFGDADEAGASVQLSSTDGDVALTVSSWSGYKCSD